MIKSLILAGLTSRRALGYTLGSVITEYELADSTIGLDTDRGV